MPLSRVPEESENLMILARRSFLAGLFVAPAIIRPGLLMPISSRHASLWQPVLVRLNWESNLSQEDMQRWVDEFKRAAAAGLPEGTDGMIMHRWDAASQSFEPLVIEHDEFCRLREEFRSAA